MEYWMGTRVDWNTINKELDRRVSRLNQSLSKTLRQVANTKGIKQSEQGKRLEFYLVNKDEFEGFGEEHDTLMLLKGSQAIRPLLLVDKALMEKNLDRVNNTPEYSSSMKPDVYRNYKQDLKQALESSVTRVGDDLNIRKEANRLGANPLQVGDLLYERVPYGDTPSCNDTNQYLTHMAYARVSKSGKRFVEIERVQMKHHDLWSNTESAVQYFNDVVYWGYRPSDKNWNNQNAHGHYIPMNKNQDQLEWKTVTNWSNKPMKFRWDKLVDKSKKHIQADYTERTTGGNSTTLQLKFLDEPGYYYNYRGSY